MAVGRGGTRPPHLDEEASVAMSNTPGPGPDPYGEGVPLEEQSPPEPLGVRLSLAPTALRDLADHWGLVLAYGVVTLGLGVVLAAWPGETLLVCAVLIAIQLIFSGAVRVVMAIAMGSAETGMRVLMGLTGALSLLVGLLCLRDPVQTVVVIGILLGAWWLISGVVDIIGAFLSPVPGRRGWDVVMGVVSILAGGFLLIDPRLSLGVLVVVICVWLFAIGLLAVATALRLRSVQRSGHGPAGAPAVPPAPAV
jgi:uncharacterized membrane protein HdeD (DUF308 family)